MESFTRCRRWQNHCHYRRRRSLPLPSQLRLPWRARVASAGRGRWSRSQALVASSGRCRHSDLTAMTAVTGHRPLPGRKEAGHHGDCHDAGRRRGSRARVAPRGSLVAGRRRESLARVADVGRGRRRKWRARVVAATLPSPP